MLPLSERRPPGARRFALSAWLCALSLAVLAALVLAVTPQAPAVASTTATTAVPEVAKQVSTTPFKARENYYCTRIPAVVTSRTGVLLAFAEGRTRLTTTGCHDVGDNDLVLEEVPRRRGDLAAPPGRRRRLRRVRPRQPRAGGGRGHRPDHSPVLQQRLEPRHGQAQPFGTPAHGPRRPQHGRRRDLVRERAAAAAQGRRMGMGLTGPGHGIQLARGQHHGRLVVPGDHTAGGDTTAGGQLYISDDGGLTWSLGAGSEASKTGAYPAELTVAETVDGGVYVNARNSAPTHCQTNEHRLETVSADGGASFAAPFSQVADLDTSPVFGSLLRLHAVDQDGQPDRLLYSGASRLGASALEDRRELAVRSSYDEGKTWKTVGTLVSAARTGYSDLTLLPNGSLGIVYETAGNIPHGNVAFAAFTEQAMKDSQTELRLPRTSDTRTKDPGEAGNHAVVHGGAQLGTRLGGVAMDFDGVDDYLRLVCSPSLRVEDKDFTVTAWFRTPATTGSLPIVWAYGMTGRHFSVRAEPGGGLVRASVGTDIGSTEVTIPFTNTPQDTWHHVVFTRQGLALSLSVDGGPAATATLPAGKDASERNLTPAGEFNIHIGARPDFPNQPAGATQLYRGGLDDVRLFDTALTTDEAASVKTGSLDVATTNEKLRLGFSTIW
ncbi:exo-alpha-sialidase [Streptomyces tanashiensis]